MSIDLISPVPIHWLKLNSLLLSHCSSKPFWHASHRGFCCLSWNKYTFAAKLEQPWFFPAKITLLAGNAFLWMVCSDFLSDFTRSSLSLHPRLINYKCPQPVAGLASACTTVACSAAAAVAICCISGSCFTSSKPLAAFLQWSAASCRLPD